MIRSGIWREYLDARYSRSELKYRSFSNPIAIKSVIVRGIPKAGITPCPSGGLAVPGYRPVPVSPYSGSPAGGHKPCLELRMRDDSGPLVDGSSMIFTEDDKWEWDPPLQVGDKANWTFNISLDMQWWGESGDNIEIEIIYLQYDSVPGNTEHAPSPQDIKKEIDDRFREYLGDMWDCDKVK